MYSSSSPGLSRFSVAVTARHTPRFLPEKLGKGKEKNSLLRWREKKNRGGKKRAGKESDALFFSLVCVGKCDLLPWAKRGLQLLLLLRSEERKKKEIEEARFFLLLPFVQLPEKKGGGGGLFPHINGKRRGDCRIFQLFSSYSLLPSKKGLDCCMGPRKKMGQKRWDLGTLLSSLVAATVPYMEEGEEEGKGGE